LSRTVECLHPFVIAVFKEMFAMRIEVPPGRLAAPTNDDEALKAARKALREALLRGESVVVREGGQLSTSARPSEQPTAQNPAIVVPPGKLASGSLYWYENDPELYRLEVQAMKRPESPFRHFQLRKEADGRLAWLGHITPGLLKGGQRSYALHAVYDHNHPHNSSYGGSVKVYMLDPDLDELSQQLRIPHLLRDSAASVYLCTARHEDFKAGKVTTSAASALAWAVRWVSLFELYLSEEISYDQFAGHI
jgi:hypothetical protein